MSKKPKGFFERFLVMDAETSGLAFNSVDPSYDAQQKKSYQSVSWGLIAADSQTMKPIDKLYVEIKYDGVSLWSDKAEQVHGLSKQHLDKHGLDEEDAISEIWSFVDHYFGISAGGVVPCAGHNVSTFDVPFMRRLLGKHDLMFKTGNRFIDTNSVGFTCYNTFTSDQLFTLMGVERDNHNSLDDAMASLKVLNYTRKICNQLLG